MSRFVIIIDRDEETAMFVVDGSEGREDCAVIFPTMGDAMAGADECMACRVWPYHIVDLDDLP